MKLVAAADLKVGMIVAEDIYGNFDLMYASKGEKITLKLIEGLEKMGIDAVYVEDESAIGVDDYVNLTPPPTQSKKQNFDVILELLSNEFNNYRVLGKNLFADIRLTLNELFNFALLDDNILRYLSELNLKNSYSLNHSIHVAMISGLIAKWSKLDSKSVFEATLSGLLHDIGKINISDDVINKSDKLDEYELIIMQNHSTIGYDLLKNDSKIPDSVKQAILDHHEKIDGSGYPSGKKGNSINEFAKIIAVADSYDAATSDKIYSSRKSPFKVIDEITEDSYNKLEPKYTEVFIRKLQKNYVGTKVKLSTGDVGEIVYLNKFAPNRPLVKTGDHFIDLYFDKHKDIIDIL